MKRKFFAGDALKTLDPVQFGKWNSYLLLKASFYEAYVSHLPPSVSHSSLLMWHVVRVALPPQAYCFFGQELLVQEKCGESIKVLQHSQACKHVREISETHSLLVPNLL